MICSAQFECYSSCSPFLCTCLHCALALIHCSPLHVGCSPFSLFSGNFSFIIFLMSSAASSQTFCFLLCPLRTLFLLFFFFLFLSSVFFSPTSVFLSFFSSVSSVPSRALFVRCFLCCHFGPTFFCRPSVFHNFLFPLLISVFHLIGKGECWD